VAVRVVGWRASRMAFRRPAARARGGAPLPPRASETGTRVCLVRVLKMGVRKAVSSFKVIFSGFPV
jgi:hypothetical protein